MTYELQDVLRGIFSRSVWAMLLVIVAVECLLSPRTLGQNTVPGAAQTMERLQQRVGELEGEVTELKRMVKELQTNSQQAAGPSGIQSAPTASSADPKPASTEVLTLTPPDKATLKYMRDTTINIGVDGYYEYNFN